MELTNMTQQFVGRNLVPDCPVADIRANFLRAVALPTIKIFRLPRM
jgi:hypothetical protein